MNLVIEPQSPVNSKLARTVEEDARRRLRRKDFRFSRCVSCEYYEGVLVLRGTVPTYYLKQLAQTAIANCPGVMQVENRLSVFPGASDCPSRD